MSFYKFLSCGVLASAVILFLSCAAQNKPKSQDVVEPRGETSQVVNGEFLISQGQSFTVHCAFEGDSVKVLTIEKGVHKEPGALTFTFGSGVMGTTLQINNCTGRHLTYDAYIKIGDRYKQTSIMGAFAGIPGFESWADSFSTLKINNIRLIDIDIPAKGCE